MANMMSEDIIFFILQGSFMNESFSISGKLYFRVAFVKLILTIVKICLTNTFPVTYIGRNYHLNKINIFDPKIKHDS